MDTLLWGVAHSPPVGADRCPLCSTVSILCSCPCGWLQGGWGAEGARGGVCGCPGAPPRLWGSPASSEWLPVPLLRKSLQASAIRVPVGQLRLYDHDKPTKVSKIVLHPDYDRNLSARGVGGHRSAEAGGPREPLPSHPGGLSPACLAEGPQGEDVLGDRLGQRHGSL